MANVLDGLFERDVMIERMRDTGMSQSMADNIPANAGLPRAALNQRSRIVNNKTHLKMKVQGVEAVDMVGSRSGGRLPAPGPWDPRGCP